MKSRTSFCNSHVLKKDITRFAPLWAVYAVFLAVWTFNNSVSVLHYGGTAQFAYSLSRNIGDIQLLFVIYGFGCATLLFGDLFKTRMAGGLHAMPLRRETWFGTHVTAGILFAAAPNAILASVLAMFMGEYSFVAWLWWLSVTGQFLFHFALAVLCVMISGNLLGHGAAFGTIEMFSMLVYGIFGTVYEPMLYGVLTKSEPFELFAPAQWWSYRNWLQWDVENAVVAETYSYDKYVSSQITPTETKYIYEGLITREWIYLAVCMVLAVAFLVLALVLYRRRKLECAGDFITSSAIRWVFLILGSMYAAIAIPVVGFVIGFFGILMLSEKTLKVFRKKNLIAFGITAVAIMATIGLTALDPAGITTRIPEETQIEFVTLNPDWGRNSVVLSDPADIRAVMDAHEYALVDRDPEDGDWYNLDLEYTLANGKTLRRRYCLNAHVPALEGIKKILSTWEQVFGDEDVHSLGEKVYRVTFYEERYDEEGRYISGTEVEIPEEAIGALLEAIYLDCQAGTMAQNMAFHEGESASLTFWYEDPMTYDVRQSLAVYEDSAHTMAFLEPYMQ